MREDLKSTYKFGLASSWTSDCDKFFGRLQLAAVETRNFRTLARPTCPARRFVLSAVQHAAYCAWNNQQWKKKSRCKWSNAFRHTATSQLSSIWDFRGRDTERPRVKTWKAPNNAVRRSANTNGVAHNIKIIFPGAKHGKAAWTGALTTFVWWKKCITRPGLLAEILSNVFCPLAPFGCAGVECLTPQKLGFCDDAEKKNENELLVTRPPTKWDYLEGLACNTCHEQPAGRTLAETRLSILRSKSADLIIRSASQKHFVWDRNCRYITRKKRR